MSAEAREAQRLNKLYAEIVKGYSSTKWGERKVYIKHFGIDEQFEVQEKYDQVFSKAIKEGLPTEKDTLEVLEKEGAWTKKEEAELQKQRDYIEGLRNSRKHLIIPSQVAQVTAQLEEASGDLLEKAKIKDGLLQNTSEKFADNRANDYSVFLSFCSTPSLSSLFTPQEFDELEKSELHELVLIYNSAMVHLSTESIKRIAIAPFFVNYFNLIGDSPALFFKKPVSELTYYQVNLLNYGRVFKSIFENVGEIPDHIMEDPDQILDFAESQKKTEKSRQKASESDGYSVVGATDGDLKAMGVKDASHKSIFDLAKEKGGNLSIADFG